MKRRALIQIDRKLIGALLAGTILAAGCAGLPPAKPATDIKAISGTWKGTMHTTRGGFGVVTLASTLTISDDGRYEVLVPSVTPPRYVGTVMVVDGMYRWKSEPTGASGTLTLHEGDGKRALTRQDDSGVSSAQYWAEK